MTPLDKLRAHSQEFRKEIIELAPNVWGAVGYAASNVYMIKGDQGLIIVDTETETTKAAENIFSEFRRITDLPVRHIFYTHSHRDHISGASVFAEGNDVEIIARSNFSSDLVDTGKRNVMPGKALLMRTKRQFGMGLSFPEERANIGVGPGDRPMEGMGQGYMEPTLRISEDRTRIERAGVTLELAAAPGETADHMIIWYADHKLLFSGDNYYKSFPNLYAIRGTRYRDFVDWADSLQIMQSFEAEILAPGHTRPVVGKDKIAEVLTDYREAINFVIEKTNEGINQGLTPDELVAYVQLPDRLAAKPHLQEFYGTVPWAVRAFFEGNLGWFDGNPTNLFPTKPAEKARRLAELAGGQEAVRLQAEKALAAEDFQWALELCDILLDLDKGEPAYRQLKSAALVKIADQQINATARNYYLLYARELLED